MPEIPLPIWIIRPRKVKSPTPHEPCDAPGHVIAFAETERAMQFMAAREAGEWQLHLLTDSDTLLLLIADLHQSGVPGLCLNPAPDGSQGESVQLTDLIAQVEKNRVSVKWTTKPQKP